MKFKLKYQLLAWLCYLFYDCSYHYLYIVYFWGVTSIPATQHVPLTLIVLAAGLLALAVKVPFAYIVTYITNRYVLKSTPFAVYITVIMVMTFLFMLLFRLMDIYIRSPYIYQLAEVSHEIFILGKFIPIFSHLSLLTGITIFITQYSLSIKLIENEKLLIKDKLEAELNLIRLQIQPDFLLSTLHNILEMAKLKSAYTADVIMQMSKILRYMLYETAKNKTTLQQEITAIEEYIRLENLRSRNHISINFQKQVDNPKQHITPMLLFPLIENAYKHEPGSQDGYIDIHLTLSHQLLHLSVDVHKSVSADNKDAQNSGTDRIKTLLQMAYSQYQFKTYKLDDRHITELSVNLNTPNA